LKKSKKAFEANLSSIYPNWDTRIAFYKRSDGEYTSMSSRVGWQSWQAAEAYGRKQALEDVANGFIKQKSWTQDMAHAVVQHAAHEGSLKSTQKEVANA
jgi:hypothetical protein